MPFCVDYPVRFADVDYARVMYYPRFFDFFHRAFEDFFAAAVGVPYHTYLTERGIGFPSVSAKADYKSPLRFGDTVTITLKPRAIGAKSATIEYLCTLPGVAEPCAVGQVTVVSVDMKSFKSVPFPPDVKAALERA